VAHSVLKANARFAGIHRRKAGFPARNVELPPSKPRFLMPGCRLLGRAAGKGTANDDDGEGSNETRETLGGHQQGRKSPLNLPGGRTRRPFDSAITHLSLSGQRAHAGRKLPPPETVVSTPTPSKNARWLVPLGIAAISVLAFAPALQ